jgi:hypothetical protein
MSRRVLLALRPVSPVERLFAAGAALARRMDADLEVIADPDHPRWTDIVTRLTQLSRGEVGCRLTPMPGIDIRQVVDYARSHEGIVSVVVGRPGAWVEQNGTDHWARLECPLVAASDSPGQPHEA